MEYAAEKKLYLETTLEILYKYMEFILSFDNKSSCNYMSIYPTLKEKYDILKENLNNVDEENLESLSCINIIISFIDKNASLDFKLEDITKNLDKKEISNLNLGLYLKRFKNSISQQLENIITLLSEYKSTNAKFLLELLYMFKTLNLSTSIKSDTVNDNLMPYYASSLGIHYEDNQTSNMYSFMMISLLAKIDEILQLTLSEINLDNLAIHNISGHIDCFNTHKDEITGAYPIDYLAASLGNFKANLEQVIEALKENNCKLGLQLGVKNEN